MQQNINPYLYGQYSQPNVVNPNTANPNAVNINIVQPQAFSPQSSANNPIQNYYPLYQTNQNPNLPLYPMNYNNMFQRPIEAQYPQQTAQNANPDRLGAYGEVNLLDKTPNKKETIETTANTDDKTKKEEDKKPKEITILTDDYVKSLENYLNDDNPKTRLIGAKEVMERFKEDESRIDNPSLVPLLNKMLKDTSPSVRFLALTTLQLGYSVGDDETIKTLKEIQSKNTDKLGEDALLASEILLKLSAPKATEVK